MRVQVVQHVDTVVYATGYVYKFPFLDGTNIVSIEDNRWDTIADLRPRHAVCSAERFTGFLWAVLLCSTAGWKVLH